MAIFKKKGKEDAKATEEEPVKKATLKKDTEKKTVPKAEKEEVGTSDDTSKAPKKASYVVCTHPDGGWQVKKTGSTKAIRRFDTKAEADAYAKKVASNNGATVIRKKKDGKIQKKL